MGMIKDIIKGIAKKDKGSGGDIRESRDLSHSPLASSLESHPSPSSPSIPSKDINAGEERRNPYGDPFDPFNPRATENVVDKPNITPPPPLPRRNMNAEVKREEREGEGIEDEEEKGKMDNLDALLPPIARNLNASQTEERERNEEMEKYGIVPDNTEEKVMSDKLEEIINDLRFLRAQNDMIMEMLKKIERKLP